MAHRVIDDMPATQGIAAPQEATTVNSYGHGAKAGPAVVQVVQYASELGEGGKHSAALAALERALRIHGTSAELHTARGWALENLTPPRWADACAAYETALALDSRQLWASVGLATVLEHLGRGESCSSIYAQAAERAAERARHEPELLELLGWCQYRLGRIDDAVGTFEHALSVDPACVSVHFDLGLICLLRGDEHAAMHYRAGLDALAMRNPERRSGPLRVALDDLDEAFRQHASIAADERAVHVHYQLGQALKTAATS